MTAGASASPSGCPRSWRARRSRPAPPSSAQAYFAEQVARHADAVAQVRTAGEVDAAVASGRVAAFLTLEGASPMEGELGYLERLHEDGVRMVTLCWNGRNALASGHETCDGLSALGRRAVRRMGELGMVVDASHLNDEGFADLLACSDAPFVASHSNSRAVCGHPRNLTDDQFRAIVERGGLVGLNYFRAFVTERAAADGAMVAGRPTPEVSFDELAAHVEHFLDLGGEDAIALGSDYDGSEVPDWLDSCQRLPAFHERMAARFGDELCEKVFFSNARDFFLRTLG
nr:membrane dipeptidase [Olsenella sp. oral taxon 809]